MDWLREWVSQDRRRLRTSDGFNLDLSFVTPRLIAMSFPAVGVEGQFRNHIDTVAAYLDERYQTAEHTNYMVFNLSGASSRGYLQPPSTVSAHTSVWPHHLQTSTQVALPSRHDVHHAPRRPLVQLQQVPQPGHRRSLS